MFRDFVKSLKEKHVTLFKVPATDFHSWNEIIVSINGAYNKHKVSYVCAEHFTEDDLITTYSGPDDLVRKYKIFILRIFFKLLFYCSQFIINYR